LKESFGIRSAHTATLLSTGKVLVVGGVRFDGGSFEALATTELYDPVANSWSSIAALTTPRFLHTATRLADGRVLIVGGLSSSAAVVAEAGQLDTAELY
jgi:type II secretory pathway component GspD/PulD (secretin)